MYNRLLSFVNKCKLLYEYQFGFRCGHSPELALTCLVDKISNALENGEYVLGLFLDFSKAFDTVNHDILFEKLDSASVVFHWCGVKAFFPIENSMSFTTIRAQAVRKLHAEYPKDPFLVHCYFCCISMICQEFLMFYFSFFSRMIQICSSLVNVPKE